MPDGDPTAMLAALDAGDRPRALEAALLAYFGPPRRTPPTGMPVPVAALFTRFDVGLIRQNRLEDPRTNGWVFYRENQDCDRWAYADEADDALVFRNNDTIEPERLWGFAIQVVLFEASFGAFSFHRNGGLKPQQREAALRGLIEVPLSPIEWEPSPGQFYVADGVVATAHFDGRNTFMFSCAREDALLGWLDKLRVDWTMR